MGKEFSTRPGFRFGQTEADFGLRFGLDPNRIFGSETEDGGSPQEPCGALIFAASAANFFLGNTTHSRVWYQGQKKCFQ